MIAQPSPSPRRPKDTQPFYLVGGGLLILTLALAIPAAREWWLWMQLRDETRTAEATITRLDPQAEPAQPAADEEEEINFSNPIGGYSVAYTFETPDGSVQGRRRIDSRAWKEYQVGDSITVEYATNNPQNSAIQGDTYARLTSTLYLIVPLLGFAALWGSWEWEARRQHRKASMRRP